MFSPKGHHQGHRYKNATQLYKGKEQLNVGVILPHKNFGAREYTRAINSAVAGLHKGRVRALGWVKERNFSQKNVHMIMMQLTPSPTGE